MRLPVWLSLLLSSGALVAMAGELVAFRIGTGGPGGTYYPVGQAISRALSEDNPDCAGSDCNFAGTHAVAQFSTGSVANVRDLVDGHLEAGLAQADVVHLAFHGRGMFEGAGPARQLRLIAGLFRESIHLVARADARIATVSDLKGRSVSLDVVGSETIHSARRVLEAHGLSEGDLQIWQLPTSEAAQWLLNGGLDAFFATAGHPMPLITELARQTDLVLVPIDGTHAARLVETEPFLSVTVIPAGTYSDIDAVATLAVGAQLVVTAGLDDDHAYSLTRGLWSGYARELLASAHPRGAEVRLEMALTGSSIPLHPGAERFYREVGLIP